MTTMLLPAASAARRLRATWRSIVAHVRHRAHELAGIWRYAKARDEFNRLPDAIMRDLAVHRSEFDSYFAESEQRTAPTRRRVADAIDHRVGR